MDQKLIRNFAIIAHIDHGKSTLADRLMEITGTVSQRDSKEQLLDSHPISRERGITIKLAPVTMNYETTVHSSQLTVVGEPSTDNYQLNLIDTPGHVDFSYEVERSLAACEGAILLVDATKGVQAQTLSHFQKAQKLNLKIIPVINKIDSPNARIEEVKHELIELIRVNSSEVEISLISAKTGEGVPELLTRIIQEIPPPSGNPTGPTRALVFSSQFDPKRGVIAYVRIVDGSVSPVEKAYFLATKSEGNILEVGHFTPLMKSAEIIGSGEVGYVATNIKDLGKVKVGDTLTISNFKLQILNSGLPGYREPQPMVFVSFFPVDQNEYGELEDGLRKLKLNDAAITFSPTSSKALGRGYRCGFLGHLHAEVSQERLEEDFNLSIIATTPTVEYIIPSGVEGSGRSKNSMLQTEQSNKTSTLAKPFQPGQPSFLKNEIPPRASLGRNYEEPWVKATIIVPQDFVGPIISLCEDRRGKLENMGYHGTNVTMIYELPLAEIITDFFDQLKSSSSGFASMDYEVLEYRVFDAVNLDILINHESIDAFSQILPKEKAERYGKFLVERLKEVIPRQQIPVPLQASVDGQIIARADIPAFRKDVTAKLYGGDSTRRMKLLEKQKKGKEKMKSIGKVQIPNDTFLKIFRT